MIAGQFVPDSDLSAPALRQKSSASKRTLDILEDRIGGACGHG